jgi:hypothetical protein
VQDAKSGKQKKSELVGWPPFANDDLVQSVE